MCTPKHGLTSQEKNELSAMVCLYTVEVDTSVSARQFLANLLFSRLPYNAQRFISKAFTSELTRILETTPFDIVQL